MFITTLYLSLKHLFGSQMTEACLIGILNSFVMTLAIRSAPMAEKPIGF